MPLEIASLIFRRSVRALRVEVSRCASCRRAPLAGELMHELESRRRVCELCLARLPESKRATVASERVPVADRRVSVIPRAA